MATSTARFCLLRSPGRLLHRCLFLQFQNQATIHTSSTLHKDDTTATAPTDQGTVPVDQAVQDNLLDAVKQPRTPTKAQKISRAMQAYMERAQAHDKMIKAEIAEYEIGRRHLANIMGKDPELFDQEDIDQAIEYLLPSGLFEKKARPVLKHPYEIFPKRKAAQFGLDGRPFHTMFYTGKPNFYALMHEVVWKLEGLKKEEDRLTRKGRLHQEADKKLSLYGSDWVTVQALKDMMLEPLGDHEHKHFVVLMERLAQHPLAYKEEDFIMKYRRQLMMQSFSREVLKPMVDQDGREYITCKGKRKSSRAEVTVRMKGSGKVSINRRDIEYFKDLTHREQVMSPLQFLGRIGEVDVECTVTGGGPTGQSGAIRLGLSRALASFVDSEMREKMRLAGLLSADVRRRERKKPGQKKARKKFTWKKR